MRKSDIISLVSDDTDLNKVKAEEAVDAIIDAVKESLARGESVTLRRFGSFSVREEERPRGAQFADGPGSAHQRPQGREFQGRTKLQGCGERCRGEIPMIRRFPAGRGMPGETEERRWRRTKGC